MPCHPYQRGAVCWYNVSCGVRNESSGAFAGAIGPFCQADSAKAAAAARRYYHEFEPICSRDQCDCPAALEHAVGEWPCVFCRPDDGPPHNRTKLWGQIAAMTKTLNPTWYSTRQGGECPTGKRPGRGDCFWRETRLLRNANASCVRANLLGAIAAKNPQCYRKCPDPGDTTSVCYVQCMLATITGTADGKLPEHRGGGGSTGGMTRSELIEPFVASFASTDPGRGGCPEVKIPEHLTV